MQQKLLGTQLVHADAAKADGREPTHDFEGLL